MHPLPALLPKSLEGKVLEMLGESLMEITATIFFELQREEQSKPWMDRQRKKIETDLVEVAELIGERAPAVDDNITLGDLALGSTLYLYEFVGVSMPIMPECGWREKHPGLGTHYDALNARPSFQKTAPIMFDTDLKKTV